MHFQIEVLEEDHRKKDKKIRELSQQIKINARMSQQLSVPPTPSACSRTPSQHTLFTRQTSNASKSRASLSGMSVQWGNGSGPPHGQANGHAQPHQQKRQMQLENGMMVSTPNRTARDSTGNDSVSSDIQMDSPPYHTSNACAVM